MSLTKYIDNLLIEKDLDKAESIHFFTQILRNQPSKINDSVTALALLHKKGETVDELTALIQLARKKVKKINFKINSRHNNLVDGCGTGGDQKNTFNISTLACLVAAGAGAYVAKHGNRSVTSQAGSSDLMESLGIKLSQTPQQLRRAMKEAHFVYLHAPNFNTAFKNVQPIRQILSQQKLKTIFNLAGPLLNPANPKCQVIGIFDKRYLEVVGNTLKRSGVKKALVLIGKDSTDELTTYQAAKIAELKNSNIQKRTIDGRKFGFQRSRSKDLLGGSVLKNRDIAKNILTGKDHSPKRDAVILNAAAILYASGLVNNFAGGVKLAQKSIATGKAYATLKILKRISDDSR